AFAAAQGEVAEDGARALTFLNSAWQAEPAHSSPPAEKTSAIARYMQKLRKALSDDSSPAKDEEQNKIAAVEEFVASLYTSFILIVIVRMRTLVVAIGGMYVLIMLALSVYPFQPQVGIRLSLIALLAFIVAAVGIVYAQMHRDATLSYITDTTP